MTTQEETIALELYSILDNIDTINEIAKGDDKLFRIMAMREVEKRHYYADSDGMKVKLNCGDYKPNYVYTYVDKSGHLVILAEVPTEQ
jgi:hypothetical protein